MRARARVKPRPPLWRLIWRIMLAVQHAVHRLRPARPALLGHVASLLDLAQDNQNAVERSSHHPMRVMHRSASAEKVDHIVDTLSHQGACRMSDEWPGLVRSTPHVKAST